MHISNKRIVKKSCKLFQTIIIDTFSVLVIRFTAKMCYLLYSAALRREIGIRRWRPCWSQLIGVKMRKKLSIVSAVRSVSRNYFVAKRTVHEHLSPVAMSIYFCYRAFCFCDICGVFWWIFSCTLLWPCIGYGRDVCLSICLSVSLSTVTCRYSVKTTPFRVISNIVNI